MALKKGVLKSREPKEKPPISDVIRELREEMGQSQSQFSRNLNVTKDAVAQWESGRREMNRWLQEKLYDLAYQCGRFDLADRISPRPRTAFESAKEFMSLEDGTEPSQKDEKVSDPYDEILKQLREITDSGQSQLIGQMEDCLSRLSDLARNMTRNKKRGK